MTLPEQAGKVITSTVDVMRNSPGLLSVILLQMATLVVIFMVSQRNAEYQQVREMAILERCFTITGK
jgi:hypothetical protein